MKYGNMFIEQTTICIVVNLFLRQISESIPKIHFADPVKKTIIGDGPAKLGIVAALIPRRSTLRGGRQLHCGKILLTQREDDMFQFRLDSIVGLLEILSGSAIPGYCKYPLRESRNLCHDEGSGSFGDILPMAKGCISLPATAARF